MTDTITITSANIITTNVPVTNQSSPSLLHHHIANNHNILVIMMSKIQILLLSIFLRVQLSKGTTTITFQVIKGRCLKKQSQAETRIQFTIIIFTIARFAAVVQQRGPLPQPPHRHTRRHRRGQVQPRQRARGQGQELQRQELQQRLLQSQHG